MIAVAIVVSEHGGGGSQSQVVEAPRSTGVLNSLGGEAPAGSRSRSPQVLEGAREFVSAFLRYEVGEDLPWVRRRLRRGATAGFAGELLRSPVRVSSGPGRAPAKIETIRVEFVTRSRGLALVFGRARRADGPEEFSFLFTRTGGRWLARAPGE
jgi:hypothetical protein